VDKDGNSMSYNLRFPGQYFDAETGKHYNFNRDYDPVTGRYVQSDPIGLDGGMNGYGYAGGSPANSVDYNGNAPTRIISPIANKVLDISIDVHDNAEINVAINWIRTYKNINFTVYIFPENDDRTMNLISSGAYEVGLHVIRGRTIEQARMFFGSYYGGGIPVAIHGGNNIRLTSSEMSVLSSYRVPFVRAAEDHGSRGGRPPVELTYSAGHSFNAIMRGSFKHYFVHTSPTKDPNGFRNSRNVLWNLNHYAR
jgi:RHS repeat-associated protein